MLNLKAEVSQKLKSIVAVSIGLRLFLIRFVPNVANPIKYTSTCQDTTLKTGKLQFKRPVHQISASYQSQAHHIHLLAKHLLHRWNQMVMVAQEDNLGLF